MDNRKAFEEAKKIINHPNFDLLSLEQKSLFFKTILNSGLNKGDIAYLLKEKEKRKNRENELKSKATYLEKLPREIFRYLIEIGEIKGKDLVYLCNSSPILKSFCLADSKDINGKTIETQEIYRLALKRMNVNLDQDETPEKRLVYVVSNIGNIDKLTISYDGLEDIFLTKDYELFSNVRDVSFSPFENIMAARGLYNDIVLYDTKNDVLFEEFPKIKSYALNGKYLAGINTEGNLIYVRYHKTRENEILNTDPSEQRFRFKIIEFRGVRLVNLGEKELKFKSIKDYGESRFLILDVENNLYELNSSDFSTLNLIQKRVKLFDGYSEYKISIYTTDSKVIELEFENGFGKYSTFIKAKERKVEGIVKKIKEIGGKLFYLTDEGYLFDYDNTDYVFQINVLDFDYIKVYISFNSEYQDFVCALDLEGNGIIIGISDDSVLPYANTIALNGENKLRYGIYHASQLFSWAGNIYFKFL